eukprot:15254940-Alexandrium_andersonii.AAC.1
MPLPSGWCARSLGSNAREGAISRFQCLRSAILMWWFQARPCWEVQAMHETWWTLHVESAGVTADVVTGVFVQSALQ